MQPFLPGKIRNSISISSTFWKLTSSLIYFKCFGKLVHYSRALASPNTVQTLFCEVFTCSQTNLILLWLLYSAALYWKSGCEGFLCRAGLLYIRADYTEWLWSSKAQFTEYSTKRTAGSVIFEPILISKVSFFVIFFTNTESSLANR